MKTTKKKFRKIIKEEVSRALNEMYPTRGNQAPLPDSPWAPFAAALDIGILDLDKFAYEMEMDSFQGMENMYPNGPATLAEEQPARFIRAAELSSLAAEDMTEQEIMAAAGAELDLDEPGEPDPRSLDGSMVMRPR